MKTRRSISRTLGFVMAVVMLFGCAFTTVPIAGTFMAAASGTLSFTVPETIYLYPTDAVSGSRSFQYFLNVNADGTVPQGYTSTGLVKFSNAAASSVSISCSDASVTLSVSDGTSAVNATIGGYLSTGLMPGETCTLTWTAQYTESGRTKTVRSYSVVYAPFANPVGAIASAVAEGSALVYASCSTFIYGIQQIANSGTRAGTFFGTLSEPFTEYGTPYGSSDYIGTGTFKHTLSNIGNIQAVPYDGNGTPDSLLNNIMIGSDSQGGTAFGYPQPFDGCKRYLVLGGTGRVYYDTSRVTRIGDIPNVAVRSFLNGAGSSAGVNRAEDFCARAFYITTDSTLSESNASYTTTPYWTTYSESQATDAIAVPHETGSQINTIPLSGGVKTLVSVLNRFWRATNTFGSSGGKTDATAAAACEFYGINKAIARERYLSEISAARQAGNDVTAWNNYQAQMQAVAEYLGNPMATSVNLTAFNNAVSALVQSQRATLTIDPNGGKWADNTTSARTVQQPEGSTVTLSDTPNRDGYTFNGWQITSGGGALNGSTYTFSAEDGTLSAHWTANTYTVTLDQQSGSGGTTSITATYDSAMPSATMPTRTGYTFGGYYSSTNGGGTEYYTAAGAGARAWNSTTITKLYAKWTAVSYAITYNLDGGSATNPTSYTIETATFTLNNPTKTGYTFAGWTGSNGTTAQTSVSIAKGSTGNKTYTANWSKDTYTITYNLDGGSATNPASYQVDTATFTLNNPTKTGYTFTGWTGSNGTTAQTSVSIAKGSTGNKTYTAHWTANTYTVTIDPNGGKWADGSTMPATVTRGAGESYVPQRPTRDGYVFQGWTLDGESGEGGTWNGSTYVFGNANRTLTAQWQAIPVILTAKPGYGVWAPYTGTQYASALSSEKVYNGTAGSTVDLIVPYSSQYFHISGWTLLPGATGTLTNPMRYQFGTSNDTAAAQVGFDNNTVFLNPGAGSWTNSNTGPASGERYLFFDPDYRMMITVNGAAKPGYRLPGSGDLRRMDYAFAGWAKTSGAGTVVQQGADWYYVFDTTQTGAPMGGAHLTAQWTIRQITLSLQNVERWTPGTQWANSGGTIRVNAGTTVTLPDASCVRYTGCSFTGWYLDNRYHGVLTPVGSPLTSITLHEDTELCAGWAYNTYTITVDPNGGYRTIQTATSSYKNYDSYTVSTVYGYWLRLFDDNSGPLKRDGYRFAGFAPANGAQFAGSIINPAENPDLYNDPNQCYYRIGPTDETLVAQWEKIPQDHISVTIGDQIGVNLLLDLDARNAQNVTVVYKDLNGVSQTQTFTDFSALPQVEGGLYKIAVQIAPAQIADSVTVYIDGEQLDACVKDYCNTLTAGGYTPEVAALAQAVLDYGQAASNFFDYSDETLSNLNGLSADDAKAWQTQFSDTTGKIQNVSFMALTKPEFRFYMKNITEAEAAGYTVRAAYADSTITDTLNARFVKNLSGSILIEVTGVMAEYMNKTITVTVDGLGTITFAGNDFAKMMANNAATETLGAALYAYGEAARLCFVNE